MASIDPWIVSLCEYNLLLYDQFITVSSWLSPKHSFVSMCPHILTACGIACHAILAFSRTFLNSSFFYLPTVSPAFPWDSARYGHTHFLGPPILITLPSLHPSHNVCNGEELWPDLTEGAEGTETFCLCMLQQSTSAIPLLYIDYRH
jgi:hypothetical protein